MNIAVIPARGGSKRIPRKNIRAFCGRPMIGWSIAAAQASGLFDRIIVSTDDSEIATVAGALGAEVPFLRPAALADDFATTVAVINHAVRWLADADQCPEAVCCLYATAPFVAPGDLLDGLRMLETSNSDYAFPVTSFPASIARALRLTPDGQVSMFQPEHLNTRSQDLEPAYHDAGQFYWGRTDAWLDARPIYHRAAGIIVPRHRVQDIDTEEDWQRAEWMFKAMQSAATPFGQEKT